MAGRGLSVTDLETRVARGSTTGLWNRLASHASGRRSGDQFCIYVADRLVLPTLGSNQLARIAKGRASMDHLTRDFIREHLTFRFVTSPDGRSALELERSIQAGAMPVGKPQLNPR